MNTDIKIELERVRNEIERIKRLITLIKKNNDEELISLIKKTLNESSQNNYLNSISEILDILNQLLERKNMRIIEISQELVRREKEEKRALREVIAKERDYSSKSNEELEREYRYIRSQIKRIAKKIWSLDEPQEVKTYYRFNDVGEIYLEKADGVSESTMLYEMRQIMEDLEMRLSTIEEYYTGTNLKEMPILDDNIYDDGIIVDEYDQYDKIVDEELNSRVRF